MESKTTEEKLRGDAQRCLNNMEIEIECINGVSEVDADATHKKKVEHKTKFDENADALLALIKEAKIEVKARVGKAPSIRKTTKKAVKYHPVETR